VRLGEGEEVVKTALSRDDVMALELDATPVIWL
jgi:hypothetical protein